jgi:hypothetical protein
MKLRISRTVLLATATLVFGSAAYAQEINVRARLPFAFVVGDKVYPAGEYVLQTATANTNFLSIKNADKTTQGLIPSYLCASTKPASPANQAKLVFHHMGNTYFLFRLWVGGSAVGREFPRSHLETQMAMNESKTETVVVAANLAH